LTALMAQPTTNREYESKMTAGQAFPLSPMRSSLVSPARR
jgi:hypothetical protein